MATVDCSRGRPPPTSKTIGHPRRVYGRIHLFVRRSRQEPCNAACKRRASAAGTDAGYRTGWGVAGHDTANNYPGFCIDFVDVTRKIYAKSMNWQFLRQWSHVVSKRDILDKQFGLATDIGICLDRSIIIYVYLNFGHIVPSYLTNCCSNSEWACSCMLWDRIGSCRKDEVIISWRAKHLVESQ